MFDFRAGEVLLINKPLTWTSFQLVNKIKHQIKGHVSLIDVDNNLKVRPKVGHAGTLDPLATGLLIVCTGKQTKNISTYQAQEKEYTGTFHIGATTPCFDLEKDIDETFPTDHITEDLIHATTAQFMGAIQQIPPLFSAVKVKGRRAYDIAREGGEAQIKAREVTIKEFEITRIALPEVDFRVICTKGTYIRSLARDFGYALNSGAHLTALCRTRIGDYELKDALEIDTFVQILKTNS